MLVGFFAALLGALLVTAVYVAVALPRHVGDARLRHATLGDLRPGLNEVKLRAHTTSCPLRSPLGVTCVWYSVEVHARRFVEWSVEATIVDAVPFVLKDDVSEVSLSEPRWLAGVARSEFGRWLTLPAGLLAQVTTSQLDVAEYELREKSLPEGAIIFAGLNVESVVPLTYRVLYLSHSSTLPQLLPERLIALGMAAVSLACIVVIVLW